MYLTFELLRYNLYLRHFDMLNTGKGLYTTVCVGPDSLLATYYGKLVYDNLYVRASREPFVYAEGTLVIYVGRF